MTRLRAARDLAPAEWIVAELKTFAESVNSLVPSGFSSYVRVFHPAWRDPNGSQLVRWSEIAAANGTTANAAMQLHALTGDLRYLHNEQPGVYMQAPAEGSLPVELTRSLIDVLAQHTTSPERCWFAVWDGFGDTRSDISSAPTFSTPNRRYHLLAGPLDAALESAVEYRTQSPNLWWPDDRAWCVATEIDLNTTYVGCDGVCRDAITHTPSLEALEVDPDAGIDWRSDPVNPWPGD